MAGDYHFNMKVTITRKRVVTQIQTDEFEADSVTEALALANEEEEGNDGNEWHDLDDVIDYPNVTEDDILEVEE